MFPATVEVVRRLQPKSFIIENVKGLTRSSFANYYQYILLQLEFPEVVRNGDEDWLDHLKRLQIEKTSGALHGTGLTYNVVPTLVNAANYGVPQKRERVFIVGFRSDLGIQWSFPRATHSLDALLYSQWVSREYWQKHGISGRRSQNLQLRRRYESRISKLANALFKPEGKPWRTVRDTLIDIPDPRGEGADALFNHNFQNGARPYHGHTGCSLDMPAKTLKAGDHGVPGGENMMVTDSGETRYFTVREAARLQTFPDGFVFHGSWTETMRQLGNAVPVGLGRIVASSVVERLAEAEIKKATRTKGRNAA
jgi:DNA (cytosine-5)-methyltransferase 1